MTQNRIGTTEFAVTPPSKVPLVFMASLLVITIVAVALTGILDPDSGLSWPAVLIVAGIEAPIFLGLVLLMRWRRVWLEPGELVVRATFYLKRTPLSAIDCSRLRILDLREHPEAKTVLRTNGVGLPGFSAGHFRDRGKRKVFALVTRPRVLLIPLTDDSRILLSLEHPRELMNRL
ncbi:MAG: PH domain-containing protein, partial [Wenzhouxiangellaceae bacterium]